MRLNVANLRKQFTGTLAVDDISFEARECNILGLLGPNGAGKTTTIRMILNIIQPDSGSILFDSIPFNDNIRDVVGYLPEERGLYRKNKLLDTLLYFASLKNLERNEAKRRAYQWLERFELSTYADRRVNELSKGNQQKVQFIISILHDPSIIFLDEPFAGLDPLNQIILKDILLDLKQKGKTIIFSTHQMDQAEKLCDGICLINKGKVVLYGDIGEIKSRYGTNAVQLEFDGDGKFLSSLSSVKTAYIYKNYAELIFQDSFSFSELLRELAPRLQIRKFETTQPSLNAIFLSVVRGAATDANLPKTA